MSAFIIDGKETANLQNVETRLGIQRFNIEHARSPHLTLLQIGALPESTKYLTAKQKLAEKLGIKVTWDHLEESISQSDLEKVIDQRNSDSGVDAILVQLPVPESINEFKLLERITPNKEVDGIHPFHLGRLVSFVSNPSNPPSVLPCTPNGVLSLIKIAKEKISGNSDLTGLNALVIGRSSLVGAPTALLLQAENMSVSTVHSKSDPNFIRDISCRMDVIVSAAGKPGLITADMIKPGAIIIDVGITYQVNKLVGDVDFDSCSKLAGAITPVPGGVGPMTMAMLMKNVLKCASLNTYDGAEVQESH